MGATELQGMGCDLLDVRVRVCWSLLDIGTTRELCEGLG
jgi:hypothetical protein